MRTRALALGVLLAATPSRAAIPADLAERARAVVEEERAKGDVPAMSVALVDRDGVRVLLASGLADREAGREATPETLFPAASVSKLVTAVLVMQQVEAGALDLDVPVNANLAEDDWVRDASGAPTPATLRQLLSHSAGLPVSWRNMRRSPEEPAISLAEHLAGGLRTIHPPGARIVYANDGFGLAGDIAAVAATASSSFDRLAARYLFRPLGMSRSSFRPPWDFGDRIATPYGESIPLPRRGRTRFGDMSANAPAGGLVTTAADLARFARMLLRDGELDGLRILTPASVHEMMRLQVRARPDMDEGFGIGFGVRERPGRKLAWWDGGLPGVATRFALLPEHGVGAVVLTNRGDQGPSSLTAMRLLELLVPAQPVSPAALAPGALASFAGTYRMEDAVPPEYWFLRPFAVVRLTARDDRLAFQGSGFGRGELLPVDAAGRFLARGTVFHDASARIDGEVLTLGFMTARRVPVWQVPLAIGGALALAGLALVAGLVWGGVRLWQRARSPSRV